jgi:hypothetical protein
MRHREIDPNRVINATVAAIKQALDDNGELLAEGVNQPDKSRFPEWIEQLEEAQAGIASLLRQLQGEKKKGGRPRSRSGAKLLQHYTMIERAFQDGENVTQACKRLARRQGVQPKTLEREYYLVKKMIREYDEKVAKHNERAALIRALSGAATTSER